MAVASGVDVVVAKVELILLVYARPFQVLSFQDQDDVLIEGLLCLLDTHVALYVPGKKEPETALLDTNPSLGFQQLVTIVSRDSSVLLDFLVSNETCFLLYFLRFLKFVSKNWSGFVESCDSQYEEIVGVLIDLKTSINRLLSKSLFPYNIAPVYRLLEKVENLHSAALENSFPHGSHLCFIPLCSDLICLIRPLFCAYCLP